MQRWTLLDDEAEHEVPNETNADDDQIEDDVEDAGKRKKYIQLVYEMCSQCLITLFSF